MVVSEDCVKKSVEANNLFLGFNLKENVVEIISLFNVIITIYHYKLNNTDAKHFAYSFRKTLT